jgi:tetratricopeptide (TPR) repeat protein
MRAETDEVRFSENNVLRGEGEVGVESVSSSLFENVTRYHAQIGADVNKDVLQQLEWNLLGEAKTLFHQKKYEEALNTFTHCLAVTEKTRSAKDHAVRGAVIHNIASCLHNLGEMEAAQVRGQLIIVA